MAFRKRNIAVGRTKPGGSETSEPLDTPSGVKPSTLTSHPVTSTGAASLDSIHGGHGGLALGSSLLIEESGTTDYAGVLLKYYAAEGLCHGHVLHVVGIGEGWVRELPAVAESRGKQSNEASKTDSEKMKIAWRYETVGPVGERALSNRNVMDQNASSAPETSTFCHTFDLSKRLHVPPDAKINYIQMSSSSTPFQSILRSLEQNLKASPKDSIHRIIIPTILSPALYPPQSSRPENFLRFLHGLRSLLRQYTSRATAMITLPLELYPRSSGVVRWAEILSDGVLEFTPFPHLMDSSNNLAESGGARANEEQPQGMVKVHKLPINTERGEGGAGVGNTLGEDLAFTVSRRKFVIKPFSLPPMEGDQEAQKDAGKITGKDVEF